MGEAELRLGWGKFSGMQGRGKVGRSFEGEKVSVGVGVGRRGEGVLAVLEHGMRVVGSEVARLGAEVKKDGVGLPVAEGTDGGSVDAREEKGGSSTRAEAVGFDAFRRDVGDVVDGGSCAAKFEGDFAGSDVMWVVGGVVVAIERTVGGGIILKEMLDAALNGS